MSEPQDWFAANAPQGGEDWFKANAPAGPAWGDPSAPTTEGMLRRQYTGHQEGAPGIIENLNEALQGPAHPTSLADIAELVFAPTDATRSVAAGIMRRIPAVRAATRENGPSGVIGRIVSWPGRAIAAFNETLPSTMAQRVQEFRGTSAAPAAAVAPAPVAPSGPDVVDRALLRGRVQMPSVPPSATPVSEDPAAAFNARYFRNAEQQRQVLGQIKAQPEMAPSHDASPLREPRVQVGAEQVGRQQGMSKEAVRDVTGPILDEAQGEASPILPKTALTRIVDDMKALPPGPEREAYVARATSGKAKWQIENIRRTLEHLGLVVPLASSGVREAVMQRLMPSHATEGQR